MSYNKTQIREFLNNWDISINSVIKDVPIMAGAKISNNVWAIGDNYFLIAANGDEEISKQLKDTAITKALAKQGFYSALPVITKAGDDNWRSSDGVMFTLTKRVPGSVIGSNISPSIAYKVGAAIAGLHKALQTLEDETAVNDVNFFNQISEWSLPLIRKQNNEWVGLTDDFFDDYLMTFEKLCSQLPRQIIHRDPNPSNILFEADKITGFIDFELSERNVRLFDPCYCATGILSGMHNLNHFDDWLEITKQILHGYNSINPLTEAEKQSVYYVICSIQLICTAYFNSVDDPDFQRLSETNRMMLKLIAENKDKINDLLC